MLIGQNIVDMGTAEVTGTAAAISSRPLPGYVQVRALGDNTDTVYLGWSGVDTSGNGIALLPGDNWTFRTNDITRIYAIANSGTQYLAWSLEGDTNG